MSHGGVKQLLGLGPITLDVLLESQIVSLEEFTLVWRTHQLDIFVPLKC